MWKNIRRVLNRTKSENKQWEKENSMCPVQVSVEQVNNNKNLPLWMKEAEADMTTCDTTSSLSDKESSRTADDDTLSTKLKIPNINWEKLNETKNKNNEILSNQRKVLTKQKNKEQRAELRRRRRKLTPSESPAHSSLEKLSNFKNHSENSILEEEEEEEQEES